MEEARITTTVIGWNGKLSTPQRIFGSVLDNLLERSTQMIVVSKLAQPLNTAQRLIIVIPSGYDHKKGLYDSVKKTKQLASQLGAKINCFIIQDETDSYEQTFNKMKPPVHVACTTLESWNEWHDTCIPSLRKSDVVLVFSTRRGTLAWHPQLESLPRVLASLDSISFVMFYPPEEEHVDLRGTRGMDMPRTVLSKRSFR